MRCDICYFYYSSPTDQDCFRERVKNWAYELQTGAGNRG